MKTLRLLPLFLAFLLVISCGKDDEDLIVGEWKVASLTATNCFDSEDNMALAFSDGCLKQSVEGFDFEVIQSNNWSKYRPKIILTEILSSNLSDLEKNEMTSFIVNIGYKILAKSVNTVFFVRSD